MKENMIKESKRGFTYIGLLLVLAIILFFVYKVINLYFKQTAVNKETGKVLLEQNIDTRNYKTIIDSTREQIKDIQTQRMKELESTQRY
ncbi:MAG: hypothetical protein PHT41_03490 [Candidatus Omnitrophica bacterium]|nr:hypothetical protein [Candidatus Omnitrophota bacterium]